MRQASLDLNVGGETVRLAYTDWGDPAAPRTVLCVHGLTRNGRDFDALAESMSGMARVVCPDMPGRGRSGWLADKEAYATSTYLVALKALLADLGARDVAWVGTSMGGLLGMLMAAEAESPIGRLVINDIGPLIPAAAVRRIAGYLGDDPLFPDGAALEARLREVLAPFGYLTDAQWRHLADHGARPDPRGLRLHYDPGIAVMFGKLGEKDTELWPLWDAIRCPTLVLRGAESDLLLAATAQEMTTRGPMATLVEWPGMGHAPALMDAGQIATVRRFVLGA
ncbi:MAG: alpha/beta hydrolase [Alphaproteobacteria bacterium]|nr:alpha/beta hydrolase [Alphaproteobacteria bacterium]